MIGAGIARWVDSRVRLAKFVRKALNHVFPDHWSFMLGEIALYAFVILVITGTFMAMFFHGSSAKVIYHGSYRPLDGVQVSSAYQSVLHLSFDVPAGLLIRQMHHWAADIFIGAIVAHLLRIFFTAAYRRPREINWLVGLTLLVLALANGYLGYSICGDLLSGAGLRIGYAIMLSIPVIGPWITFLALGGTVPVAATVPRLYALHIFLVPALITLLIGVHLAIIWRQLHTNYPGPKRTDKTIVGARLWPSYTLKSLGLFLLLFAVVAAMGGLLQIDPVWIYGPYNPVAILPGAQPDWYLGWVEGAMRLFPGVNLRLGRYLVPEVFFPGFLFPVLVFMGLYAWPFLEKFLTFDFRTHHVLRLPRQQPWITAFGCAVLSGMLVLLFAGGDDVVALAENGSVTQIRTLLRILVFVLPAVTFALVYLLCRLANWKYPVASAEQTPEEILQEESTPQPQ
ncbi:MAG TPA: cytochrome bc complex cytochrome b subunit [Acidobacteriaceae bacterium]|jgi:ubiquinol-cytochrome c reductase cytochrome b subunit|nr:cytochrome bc complex cytochrome b subunit [Acidobacteriaceae bacterium]